MTIKWDLSALNSRPVNVRTGIHGESIVWAPETVQNIRLRSSMKACSKGNEVLLVQNIGTFASIEYPRMMVFIPAKKIITERVQQVKIPHRYLSQSLVADLKNDLLKIHL